MESAMKMVPVKSSNVEAIGYDPDTHDMHVTFKGGATYVHRSVSTEQHEAFASAASVGSHYHKHFRGNPAHDIKRMGA